MAPVSQIISTTGKVSLSSTRANTEIYMTIQAQLQAWIDAINEPNEIALVAGFQNATTWNGNPHGMMIGFNKAATGGNYQYGVNFHRTAHDSYLRVRGFYNWEGLSSANNGYGNFSSYDLKTTDNPFWNSGDGYQVYIGYCADPGNQWFAAVDTYQASPWGIFRCVRPAGPSYPSKQYASDWVAFAGNDTTNPYFTLSNSPAATSGYGAQTRTFATPADSFYVVSGGAVLSRSLYLGNRPPGMGHVLGLGMLNTISGSGTEVWRYLGRQLCVREVE